MTTAKENLKRSTVHINNFMAGGIGQGSGTITTLRDACGITKPLETKISYHDGSTTILHDVTISPDDIIIVTCQHVVAYSREIEIITSYNKAYRVFQIAGSGIGDVAALWVPEADNTFIPAKIGDSSTMRQGMKVVAIGSPHGEEQKFSLTDGNISSEKRYAHGISFLPAFQIDAETNPGNSGCMVADAETLEWIGMHFAGVSSNGSNTGIGFTLRIGDVLEYLTMLFANNGVPQIGWHVELTQLDATFASILGLENNNGVLISSASIKASPFYGKLFPGDVVLAVNGNDVIEPNDFSYYVEMAEKGSIDFTVFRNKQKISVSVTPDSDIDKFLYQKVPHNLHWGFTVIKQNGYKSPIVDCVYPGTPAYRAGIVPAIFIAGVSYFDGDELKFASYDTVDEFYAHLKREEQRGCIFKIAKEDSEACILIAVKPSLTPLQLVQTAA